MPRGQLSLRVYLDGLEPFTTNTRIADHNLWDITRAKHKWPPADEAPMTWLAFIAWASARRTGHIDGIGWDDFLQRCEAVENLADDDEADDVTPTQPGPGPG